MEKEYENARAKFLAVSAKFRVAQTAYRAREIGDEEFLAARSAFYRSRQGIRRRRGSFRRPR